MTLPTNIKELADHMEAHERTLEDAECNRDLVKWIFDQLEEEGFSRFIQECIEYGSEKLPRKDAA